MAQSKRQYFNELAKKIISFYLEHRSECQGELSIAENPSLSDLYETMDDETEVHMLFAAVSTVVLTANKYEKNILHAHWYQSNGAKIRRIKIKLLPQRESTQETYAYSLEWHGYRILHIEAQSTGSYTLGGIADIIRYIVEDPYLYPTTVISLGICFGVNENRQALGDTYISDKVYPYFMGAKWDEKGYFVDDNHMFRLNTGLRGKIKSEILDANVLNVLDFKTDFGNFITGEAVISNKDIRDLFVGTTTQNISAGDMEGYGLFKECCGRNIIIPCLIIKSICDWGVLKNLTQLETVQKFASEESRIDQAELKTIKDSLQAFASFHAYRVLDLLLKQRIFSSSIQEELSQTIRRKCEHEHIVHGISIQDDATKIGQKLLGNLELSTSFLIAVTKNLEQVGLLFKSEELATFEAQFWKINC